MNCPKDKKCCWDCGNSYVEYNASGKPSEIICCLELDFCGTPCKFMEDKINRLEEENKQLNIELSHMCYIHDKFKEKELPMIVATAKAEARKEFADRLIAISHPYADTQMVFEIQIKNLLKEMGIE